MIIYKTKDDLIKAAQERGSKAKSFKGAVEYLKRSAPSRPVWAVAPRASRYNGQKESYLESVRIEREERYLNSQGKLSQRQKEARKHKRDLTITNRAKQHLTENWPLRRSQSSWAGGEHTVLVSIGDRPYARGWSKKVWSDNGKWAGTNSVASITATRRTFRHFPTLTTPDGMVVVDAKKIGHREYQITWVEQSRGFDLKIVDGFLIRGYHVKAKTIDAARKKAVKARQKALKAALEIRQKRLDIVRKYSRIWVSLQDSLEAGNCMASSKQVEEQLKHRFGNIGGVRADILLKFRDDIFTRKAVAVAARRYV